MERTSNYPMVDPKSSLVSQSLNRNIRTWNKTIQVFEGFSQVQSSPPLLSLNLFPYCSYEGFSGGSDGKESACNTWRPQFHPWVRKIPWRREWPSTPVTIINSHILELIFELLRWHWLGLFSPLCEILRRFASFDCSDVGMRTKKKAYKKVNF